MTSFFYRGPPRDPLKRMFAGTSEMIFDVCYFGIWADP